MHLANKTPFQVLAFPTVCQNDNNHLIVIVKATFDIDNRKQFLNTSDQQQDIFLADQYWGDATDSSLRYEADIALIKPQTDVAVNATAYPENGSARVMDASISIGSMKKIVRVFGHRQWEKVGGGYQISAPQTFDNIPLLYENAYGGGSPDARDDEVRVADQRNPVGKGYIASESKFPPEDYALPNLENPDNLIQNWRDQPEPWGLGFIARHWLPRKTFTGSYDSDWERNRKPLLPRDFEDRAHNAASYGLAAEQYLEGGEVVKLTNLSQAGPLSFSLPKYGISIESHIKNQSNYRQAILDTVVIEPDDKRVCMTWRTSFQVHWNLSMISWIKVTC